VCQARSHRHRRSHRPIAILLAAVVCTNLLAHQADGLRALVGATTTGVVTGVVDGDTFDVALDGRRGAVRVRIFGIDAPERGEPYSNVALRQARVLLFDQRVTLVGRDVDRYGRLVASVSAGGQDVATALVEAGLACHFTRYSDDARLARAEAGARSRGSGFWAPGAPKPRCALDATAAPTTPATAGPFRGNVSSRVYHAPACRNYTCKNCTRVFQTEAAARREGFRPAQDCLR
jgi:endonuclease YncB( thermonuclease family)